MAYIQREKVAEMIINCQSVSEDAANELILKLHQIPSESVVPKLIIKRKESSKQKPHTVIYGARSGGKSYEMVKTIKNETIDQMVERLKERLIQGGIYPVFVKNVIYQTAKELKGE